MIDDSMAKGSLSWRYVSCLLCFFLLLVVFQLRAFSSPLTSSPTTTNKRKEFSKNMSDMDITPAVETAKEMMLDESKKAAEKAMSSFRAVANTGFCKNVLLPFWNGVKSLYNRAPLLARVGILIVVGMSIIPVGCFAGFMTIITVGCFVLGAIAFSVVEVTLPAIIG